MHASDYVSFACQAARSAKGTLGKGTYFPVIYPNKFEFHLNCCR